MIWLAAIVVEVALLIAIAAGFGIARKRSVQPLQQSREALAWPMLLSCLVCTGSIVGIAFYTFYLLGTIVDGQVSAIRITVIASGIGLLSRPAQFQLYITFGGQNVELNGAVSAIIQTVPLCIALVLKYAGPKLEQLGLEVLLGVLAVAVIAFAYRAGTATLAPLKVPIGLFVLFQVYAIVVRSSGDGGSRDMLAVRLLDFCSAGLALLLSVHLVTLGLCWSRLLWTSFLLPALLGSFGAAVGAMAGAVAGPSGYHPFDVYASFLFHGSAGTVGLYLLLHWPVGMLLGVPNGEVSLDEDPYLRDIVRVARCVRNLVARIPFVGDFFSGIAEAVDEGTPLRNPVEEFV